MLFRIALWEQRQKGRDTMVRCITLKNRKFQLHNRKKLFYILLVTLVYDKSKRTRWEKKSI